MSPTNNTKSGAPGSSATIEGYGLKDITGITFTSGSTVLTATITSQASESLTFEVPTSAVIGTTYRVTYVNSDNVTLTSNYQVD